MATTTASRTSSSTSTPPGCASGPGCHPQVTIELDETNDQRLWAFASAQHGPTWFDNGHLHGGARQPAKLLHDVWSTAPWLPPSLVGSGLLDGTIKAPDTLDELMAIGL